MLRKGLNEFRVGLFVAAGFLLMMVIIFMTGGQNKLFVRHVTLYANFQNISGLREGAAVQLSGLKVGVVDNILFPENLEKHVIRVVLKIEKQYQSRMREDSVATVETLGLLGDKFIYISMGSDALPMLSDKSIIKTKETTSIFALAEKVGTIMDDIGEASKSINDLLASVKGTKGEGDFKGIVSSLRASIEQIQKGNGLAHAIIYDPQGARLISDLATTLKSVREIASGEEKELKGKGTVASLQRASADLEKILGAIRRGEGTLGKFVNDPSVYDDLRTLLGRANRNQLLKAVIRSTLSENDKQITTDR